MKISIVIPVFNSDKILDNLIITISQELKKGINENEFEIILINDFSSDKSWEKIQALAESYKFIKGINLYQNFGQHNAIMAGLNNCTGEHVITMDDDLQHHPKFILDISKTLKNYDACYTYYNKRKHKKWKKFVSWSNNIVTSFLLNKPFYIYLSSFRGMRKDIVKKIINFKEPNVYLDSLIISSTQNIKMITIDHQERYIGESNYDLKKLLILWSNMLLNFSFKPVRFSSFLGLFLKIFVKFVRRDKRSDQYLIKEKTF